MIERGRPATSALYCLDTNLCVSKKLDGVTISNGLVWTRDARQFFYIDTPTHQVQGYDFDPAGSEISNRRIVAEIPAANGAPDGMAIDEDDKLWVALFGGGKVVRIDPATGKTEFEVLLPAQNVTSCAFGGPGLLDLYITTARVGLSPEQLQAQPLAGSLFRIKLPYRGVIANRFGRDF
jgi:sugar lactone lactonase YvrE